jgi:hypothetical protein
VIKIWRPLDARHFDFVRPTHKFCAVMDSTSSLFWSPSRDAGTRLNGIAEYMPNSLNANGMEISTCLCAATGLGCVQILNAMIRLRATVIGFQQEKSTKKWKLMLKARNAF